MKFIMISELDPSVDFPALLASGIEGVYIRSSFGISEDKLFDKHYSDAKTAGMKVSAYHELSSAKKTLLACKEGRAFGSAIKGKTFDMPIAVSFGKNRCVEKRDVYNVINAFAQNIDKTSRKVPVYETENLIIAGNYLQLDIICEHQGNKVYPKWCLGDRLYMDADYLPVDDFGEFVVYEEK